MKNLFPLWQKDTIENCKMNSQKFFFSLLQLPPWGALRYLYRKNITNIHLLNTETAHRFMRHQNEHSKRAKWVYITRSKNMHFWKQSYFVLFLQIVGSNNTAIDSSAASFSSAEVFPTNSQASISFKLSSLNIRPWNVESLESTNNSHLALMQGVARATVQMNRRMREREQRELEREQLQINKDRREREIRMKRNREMIERERREMRRSRREWQEAGEQCNKRRYFLGTWNLISYNIPVDLEIFVQM